MVLPVFARPNKRTFRGELFYYYSWRFFLIIIFIKNLEKILDLSGVSSTWQKLYVFLSGVIFLLFNATLIPLASRKLHTHKPYVYPTRSFTLESFSSHFLFVTNYYFPLREISAVLTAARTGVATARGHGNTVEENPPIKLSALLINCAKDGGGGREIMKLR